MPMIPNDESYGLVMNVSTSQPKVPSETTAVSPDAAAHDVAELDGMMVRLSAGHEYRAVHWLFMLARDGDIPQRYMRDVTRVLRPLLVPSTEAEEA